MAPANILSIDVEEWFHYEYFLRHGPPQRPLLDKVMPTLLKILAERNTRATFFCVGEVMRDEPHIIEMIRDEGHEIGSHNFVHKPLWQFESKAAIEKDLLKSIKMTKTLTGKRPRGYRAPYFSIDSRNPWMMQLLSDLGFDYDASLFPRKTPLYGAPEAPLGVYKPAMKSIFKHDPDGELWEYPMSVYGPLRIPFSGGFYLRSMPLPIAKYMLRSLNKKGRQGIVYFHPWEMHAPVPKVAGLSAFEKFVTNTGVSTLGRKLASLLKSSRFGAFEEDLLERT